jgi:hypothetical protein
VTDEEMNFLNIRTNRTLPEWNYTIKPYAQKSYETCDVMCLSGTQHDCPRRLLFRVLSAGARELPGGVPVS